MGFKTKTDFMDDQKHKELTEKIIVAFYKVFNPLGYGFLEKVYEKALLLELAAMGLRAQSQSPIQVVYQEEIVGEYFADVLVEEKVIVEVKATRSLTAENEAQLLNYLKATDCEVGLLFNFGPKPEVRRRVFENSRK